MLTRHRFVVLTAGLMLAAGWATQANAAQNTLKGTPGTQSKPKVDVSHYQDWDVRCPQSSNAQARCEMTQMVQNPNNGKPIMRVVMGYPPQANSAAMIFVTPLGTRLAPGLKLSVDGDKARRFPFQICLKQGCRADYPVRSELLRKLKAGSNAQVTLVGPRGKKIRVQVSLQGFTAANNRIAQ